MNGKSEVAVSDVYSLGASAEHCDGRWHDQFLRDPRQSIVIAANDKRCDARLMQPPHLAGQKPGCFH
ncbi:hypothetical protein D3C80_1645730 [compost metagenome]